MVSAHLLYRATTMSPLHAPPPINPPEEAPPAWALPQLCGPGGRRWRALLADDNAINREVGVAMLEGLGLCVDTACDGDVAVQMAETGHYDLVLMGLQMPRLDGLTATRHPPVAGAARRRKVAGDLDDGQHLRAGSRGLPGRRHE